MRKCQQQSDTIKNQQWLSRANLKPKSEFISLCLKQQTKQKNKQKKLSIHTWNKTKKGGKNPYQKKTKKQM